jgi:hypothetical protein
MIKRIFTRIFFLINEQPLEYKLALYLPLVRALRLKLRLKFGNRFNIFPFFKESDLRGIFWDRWYIYKKLFEKIKKIEHQFTYKEFDYFNELDEFEFYFYRDYRYYRSFDYSLFEFFDFSISHSFILHSFNINEGLLFYLWKYRSSNRNIDFYFIASYLLTCICSPTYEDLIKIL